MNYNANTGGRQSLGRKLKRVADVNSMGYSPYDQPPPSPPAPAQNMYPTLDPGMNSFQQSFPPMENPQYTSTPQMPQQSQNFNQPYTNLNMNPLAGVPQNLSVLGQPVVQDMALQYGQQLAGAGTTMLKQEVEKIVPISKLKYYFAVDTKYVMSKILLLFFPFNHKDWSVKYEGPIQPRFEINVPDLYIPVMGYVTYVVTAGLVLGMQDRFSPEQIGILASSALAWCLVELAIYSATLYIIQIETNLRTLDLLAYIGYKFVGIILSILVSLLAGRVGYYVCLAYSSFSLMFFITRSLKLAVLAGNSQNASYYDGTSTTIGHKRRLYFLLFLAVIQPLLSWWLSYHLISSSPTLVPTEPEKI
ncbi:protein YIF1B-A [Diabrotica virgifera virgifera]|uniref:Protein YIF1 n=1 Tax=Diabrotica virgifera virgifera TaxID=50390 RepID=A0A6P7F2M7_DIAVI|nr:protein YIF1B-A [Diabrotica virgifera virgifera]